MSDDDVLEHSSQDDSSLVDVAELLEIANSKVFDDQDGFTERKKNFEKVTSFFDLIKSSNNEDANLAEPDQSPESSAEETLDEEIVGLKISSNDEAADDKEIGEEIVGLKIGSNDGASDDKEIGFVTSGTFGPSVNAPVAMGYIKSKFSEIGTYIKLEIRGKKYGGKVSELPFYKKNYVK